MSVFIERYRDVNRLYLDVLYELLYEREDAASPRGMKTRETLGARLVLEQANACVITIPERKLNYHFMVAEFWWIATGRNDVASIAPYCSEIARFSDDGETFFGAYGAPWVSQLGYVIEKLRADPDSRQAVLTIWRQVPPATKDVPCTIAMQYLVRKGKLNTIVTMRSSDAWLGLPYDIFNFSRLAALVAGELGVPLGWLQLQLGSLHLYERNFAAAGKLLENGVTPSRSVELPGFTGRIPADGETWEERIRSGDVAFISDVAEEWLPYLSVLVHRHRRVDSWLVAPWDAIFRSLKP